MYAWTMDTPVTQKEKIQRRWITINNADYEYRLLLNELTEDLRKRIDPYIGIQNNPPTQEIIMTELERYLPPSFEVVDYTETFELNGTIEIEVRCPINRVYMNLALNEQFY